MAATGPGSKFRAPVSVYTDTHGAKVQIVNSAGALLPSLLIPFVIPAGAAAGDYDGVIAIPFAWKLISATERHQTLGTNGSAVTLMPTKVPSGTAKASGTSMLTAGFDLKGTNDTNQAGTLSATASDYTGAAGDGVALVSTGTLTAVDGVAVTLEIQRI